MNRPYQLAISGVTGRMGGNLLRAIGASTHPQFKVVVGVGESHASDQNYAFPVIPPSDLGGSPPFDVLIDFSSPTATLATLQICADRETPAVIGTTGFNDKEMNQLESLSARIPMVISSNMSLGVNLLWSLAQQAGLSLQGWDTSILETHHKNKLDAPSGTAITLQDRISDTHPDTTVHSIRAGDVVGEHSVSFNGPGEKLVLSHTATDRIIFANGALQAALWLVENAPLEPRIYSMKDILQGGKQ